MKSCGVCGVTMKNTDTQSAKASGASEAAKSQEDTLLPFQTVYAMLGLRCRTGHSARNLAKRGLIREVRFGRVIRYSRRSVEALVAGRAGQ